MTEISRKPTTAVQGSNPGLNAGGALAIGAILTVFAGIIFAGTMSAGSYDGPSVWGVLIAGVFALVGQVFMFIGIIAFGVRIGVRDAAESEARLK